MKAYPDRKTELCCKGVFIAGIAEAVIAIGLIVLLAVTGGLKGEGSWMAKCRVATYVMFAATGIIYALCSRIGMRPKFSRWVSAAGIVFGLGCIPIMFALGGPFSDKELSAVLGISYFVAAVLLALVAILIALACYEGIAGFENLRRDQVQSGISIIAAVVATIMLALVSIIYHSTAPMKFWEAIPFVFVVTLIVGIPTAILHLCSRLNDPILDREYELDYANKVAATKDVKAEKKPEDKKDKKNEKDDRNKAKDNVKENKDKNKDKDKDRKDRKKDKNKDKNKDAKDGAEENAAGVISTTRPKSVKSTNPTDLDAFLRNAEEEEERKERDAAWEAAREKKEAVRKELEASAESVEAATEAAVEAAKEAPAATETVFTDKNSKKKDKNKEKERRRKEKEKERE
ncbi:MAG: hypothetical protein IJM57_05070, partial [Lachnospiraceae bacterium]|nr:hypothetical protein [Lachnospiraceae bacterium]